MKKNQTRLTIYPAIFLFFSISLCFAKTAEDYFQSSDKKYLSGDLDGAITDTEKALALDNNNESYKNFLGLCLNEAGNKYFNEKKYSKALPYFEKLIKLYPDDKVTVGLYELCRRKLGIPVEVKRPAALKIPPVPEKVVITRQTQQEKSGKKVSTLPNSKFLYVFALVLFSILIYVMLIILRNKPVQEKINKVEKSDLDVKLHEIDTIASQAIDDGDRELPKILLSKYLKDDSYMVKCYAISALYKITPLDATEQLKSLLAEEDPLVRIEAIGVLKNFLPTQAIEILINLSKRESNKEVKRKILGVLYEFLRDKKNVIPDRTIDEINLYIKETKKNEKWIVK